MIADETLRLPVGSRITLGKETYNVVGTTKNFISSNGDGIAFVTVQDAQAIQFDVPGEGVRLERAARETRGEAFEAAVKQPSLLDNAEQPTRELPAIARPQLRLELGEERKRIRHGAREASDHHAIGQRANLARAMLHHDIANRDLAVSRHGHDAIAPHAENRRCVDRLREATGN